MKAERDTKIRELWEQGKNNSEIARELGVDRMAVSRQVEELVEGAQNAETGKMSTPEETSPTNENTTTETEYEDSVFEDDRIT